MNILERMRPDSARFADAGWVRFSRQSCQVHYLLAQLTTDSVRLVVLVRVELNCFHRWHLLSLNTSDKIIVNGMGC